MDAKVDNETDASPTRRRFLSLGLWGILGLMAGGAIWAFSEPVLSRLGLRKKLVYIKVLELDEMPEAGVKKVEVSLAGAERPDTRIFLKRTPDGGITAISAICTHLGCLVGFNRLKSQFICPCHGGVYDMEGNVLSGPPPKPLNRLPVKVEDGSIMVGFRV